MKQVTITINDRQLSASPEMTILEVAQENNIDIPTLCYRQELAPIGACRICIVEVEKSKTLVGSCYTPITQGMVIHTHSEKVLQVRKMIVELLLASHCGSCFMCKKANICELRSIATDLEVGLPRFQVKKRYYSVEDAGPFVVRDLTKCVLCRRCVRACNEIKKEKVFGIAYRGFDSKVVVDFDQSIDKDVCQDCDVCISFCPTGALSKHGETGEEKTGEPLIISG